MALSSTISQKALGVRATIPRLSRVSRPVVCQAQNGKDTVKKVAETAIAIAASTLLAGSAGALTFDELQGLTYLQVKGTGIANTCPTLSEKSSSGPESLKPGTYRLENFCVEPSTIQVKEESTQEEGQEFVDTLLMTRNTYTLDGMSGKFIVSGNKEVTFEKDEEGIDFAPTTVQVPGGERVPFLFTFKKMNLKGSIDGFSGDFAVPSYRGSTFLDPKGRGGSTGYDTAVALPAAGDRDELAKENLKSTATLKGTAAFSVAKYDAGSGEVVGVFESIQPSDTDLGSKAPKDVKIKGVWYGQLS